jgi:hypothetical protein
MSFEEFIKWAEGAIIDWQELPTLGRRSRFQTKYDSQRGSMIVINSRGKEYVLSRGALSKIFERYITAPGEQIHRANYYTDPIWPETPHRIAAAYISALLRYWAENCQ